jgi:glycosyltransferase involved in cell wall biosynthesis
MPAQILLVHQNFPGQYLHLAPALVRAGIQVTAIGVREAPTMAGVRYLRYRPQRGSSPGIHPWVGDLETKVIRGEACLQALAALKAEGYHPDLICAHPGWGEALFLKELWPNTPQLHYLEFFYGTQGLDADFDPEFGPLDLPQRARLVAKNANNLLNLHAMDAGVAPTHWQHSTLPSLYQPRVAVIHDGIDTTRFTPDRSVRLTLRDDQGRAVALSADTPLVTFVNRNLEPMRGFHTFMRALPELLERLPTARVVIVGDDGVSYGSRPAEGSWKARLMAEIAGRVDLSRLHCVGRLPHQQLTDLLRLSWAHVYLTYPFVLSWSMLEAMSLGAVVVGSDTAPVREVIQHGHNGWLVDFFDPAALARQVAEVVTHPADQAPIRHAARQTVVECYDLHRHCLPAQMALLRPWLRAS